MNDWKVIFQGNESAARELASLLETHGLRSLVDDRQGPIVTHGGARDVCSLVLVPPQEAERSAEVLRQWKAGAGRRTRVLSGRLGRLVKASFIPPVVWVLGYLLFPDSLPTPSIGWLVAVWLVTLVASAQVEHRRSVRERISLPAAQQSRSS